MERTSEIIKNEIESQLLIIKENEKQLRKLRQELKEVELMEREEPFLCTALIYKHFLDENNRKPRTDEVIEGINLSSWLSHMKALKYLTPKMSEILNYLVKRVDKLNERYDMRECKNKESADALFVWLMRYMYFPEYRPILKLVSPEELFHFLKEHRFTDVQLKFLFLKAAGKKNKEIAKIMSMVTVNHIEGKVSRWLRSESFKKDVDLMITNLMIKAIEEEK